MASEAALVEHSNRISNEVRVMVKKLEETKQVHESAASDITKLIKSHLALIAKMEWAINNHNASLNKTIKQFIW